MSSYFSKLFKNVLKNNLPLLVQLNWGKDDREGRFSLKRKKASVRGFPMDNIHLKLENLKEIV